MFLYIVHSIIPCIGIGIVKWFFMMLPIFVYLNDHPGGIHIKECDEFVDDFIIGVVPLILFAICVLDWGF